MVDSVHDCYEGRVVDEGHVSQLGVLKVSYESFGEEE